MICSRVFFAFAAHPSSGGSRHQLSFGRLDPPKSHLRSPDLKVVCVDGRCRSDRELRVRLPTRAGARSRKGRRKRGLQGSLSAGRGHEPFLPRSEPLRVTARWRSPSRVPGQDCREIARSAASPATSRASGELSRLRDSVCLWWCRAKSLGSRSGTSLTGRSPRAPFAGSC